MPTPSSDLVFSLKLYYFELGGLVSLSPDGQHVLLRDSLVVGKIIREPFGFTQVAKHV